MIVTEHRKTGPIARFMVIFDRDGTLCKDFEAMDGQTECVFLPGVVIGLQTISNLSCSIAIATNQSYIGRGILTGDDVRDFHNKLIWMLSKEGVDIDYIAVCPHTPLDDCNCRKPKPGMLNKLIELSGIKDRDRIIFVGDKDSDEKAAMSAGIVSLSLQRMSFDKICGSIVSRIKEIQS